MKISAIKEWYKWPEKRTVSRLAYTPGFSELLADGALNLWRPSGVTPNKKPAPLFIQLVEFLTQNLTPEERKWFWQWLAYPLQHPGAKLYSAVIMYSHHGGTGKTLLGYTMRRIYGEQNCAEVDQGELHSQFNRWARRRQFIIGAEISGSDKRSDSDKLKHMISRETITINEKYQPEYELDDTCNYYLTTNHSDAVYIEDGDRRYFVVDIPSKPLTDRFYKAYDSFYKSEAGIGAIFGHLLDVDLEDFNPEAHPPQTTAKIAMHEVSGSEIDGIVRDLVRDPTSLPTVDGSANRRELFTLAELTTLLDPVGRISRIQLGKALRKAGAPQPFRTGIPGTNRVIVLYAIANFEKWSKALHGERAKHYAEGVGITERRAEKVQGTKRVKSTNKIKAKPKTNGKHKVLH